MIVLGMDQAPSGSGYCHGDGSGVPSWGYHEFPNYGDNEASLISHIRAWLTNLVKSSGAQAIVTEQILINKRHTNVPVILKQCAVVCAVATVAGDLGLDHYQADVSVWRKHFLRSAGGSSETLKDLARVRCAERGWLIDNHHVAEACGIWDWGLCELDRVYRHRSGHHRRRAENADDARKVA
jgi:hypothetical protein